MVYIYCLLGIMQVLYFINNPWDMNSQYAIFAREENKGQRGKLSSITQ